MNINGHPANATANLASADLVPAITCICADAKVSETIKCQASCGSLAGLIPSLKDRACKDPKALADQAGGLLAKFTGGKRSERKNMSEVNIILGGAAPKGKGVF
jgi:hypothetical protein